MVRNQAEVSGRLNNEVGSVLNRGKHVPKWKRCSRWRKGGKKIGTAAEAGRKKAEITDFAFSTTCSVLVWSTTSLVGLVKLARQAKTTSDAAESDGEVRYSKAVQNFLI